MNSTVAEPAGQAGPGRPTRGQRVGWLRERLCNLAKELGRVPTAAELGQFLRRYQVSGAEAEALIEVAAPIRAQAEDAPKPSAVPAVPAQRGQAGMARGRSPRAAEPLRANDRRPASSPCPKVGDRAIDRVVDDLIDDWHRAGFVLGYEDVTRLATKRELSAEQVAAVLARLKEDDVDVTGLTEPAPTDMLDDDPSPSRMLQARPSSDLVGAYMREIGRYPLIWAEDEVRLGRQIQGGLAADEALGDDRRLPAMTSEEVGQLQRSSRAGRRAHAELVRANLRLVVSIAKKRAYEGSGIDFIDRIQDGNLGLMHAANKFDPNLGYKFSTYATWWIKQHISRGIADRGRLIRLPVHIVEKLGQLRRQHARLETSLGRIPSTVELATALAWKPAEVQAMLDYSRPTVSLHAALNADGDITLGDLLSNQADIDGRYDPADAVVRSSWARDLEVALMDLDARAAEVMRRRYGLHGGERETLDQISEYFGVTRERIRQIESKAKERLRLKAGSSGLREYLYEMDEPKKRLIEARETARARRSAADDSAARASARLQGAQPDSVGKSGTTASHERRREAEIVRDGGDPA